MARDTARARESEREREREGGREREREREAERPGVRCACAFAGLLASFALSKAARPQKAAPASRPLRFLLSGDFKSIRSNEPTESTFSGENVEK